MNDFVRGKTRQKDGTVPLGAEILAGGCVSLKSTVAFVTETQPGQDLRLLNVTFRDFFSS